MSVETVSDQECEITNVLRSKLDIQVLKRPGMSQIDLAEGVNSVWLIQCVCTECVYGVYAYVCMQCMFIVYGCICVCYVTS